MEQNVTKKNHWTQSKEKLPEEVQNVLEFDINEYKFMLKIE